jgi:hypothetical protein
VPITANLVVPQSIAVSCGHELRLGRQRTVAETPSAPRLGSLLEVPKSASDQPKRVSGNSDLRGCESFPLRGIRNGVGVDFDACWR